ncbi:unnamed protein product [Ilex paraguariensis]|uniref:Uncharacterized protein n=1 Tax=Ilex paraguariensis TaxID=185542 RepID=A0ABC8TS53_9AQUA
MTSLEATTGTLIGRIKRLDVSTGDLAIAVNVLTERIGAVRVDMHQDDNRSTGGDHRLRINHQAHGQERKRNDFDDDKEEFGAYEEPDHQAMMCGSQFWARYDLRGQN